LQEFSEQQLVECVTLALGCHGGNAGSSFKYYKSHNVILEDDYVYTAKSLFSKCEYDTKPHTQIMGKGKEHVKKQSPDQMKEAL